MITLNASGGSVTFTFSGNSTYLNDGTITVPVNSLALIIDESDMISFKKANSNDLFVSANIAEFGMTKAELESWFKANAVGSTGGGGGITSGEVQTMIDESISGKADSSAVTEEISAAVSGKVDTEDLNISGKTLYVGDYCYGAAYEMAKYYSISTKPTKLLVKTTVDANETNVVAFQLKFDNGTTSSSCTLKVSTAVGSGITEAAWQVETPEANLELVNGEVYITFLNGYYLTMFKPGGYPCFVMQIVTDIESGSTPSVVESGIYNALDKMSETLTDVITKSDAAYYKGISNPSLYYDISSGITLSSFPISGGDYNYSSIATDASINANNGVLGVYTTGATHAVIKNYSVISYRININSIPSNIKMYWNLSYTGNTSHNIAVSCTVNDGTNGYCQWDWENNQYVPNDKYINTAVTLSYDSTNQVVTITPSSSSALTSIIYVKCNRSIAPANDLTNAGCRIGLVTIDTNSYKLQEALDNKQDTLIAGDNITISGNVISATGGGSSLPISAGTGTNSVIVGSKFNEASGAYSVAQGEWTKASGGTSHAEGTRTKTYGIYSHAEGSYSEASGPYSHAEGDSTYATAQASHSEGNSTSATSMGSHSEGRYTQANGMGSHSEGYYTIAENEYEHANGKFNASNTGESTSAQTLFSVGNGGWDETLQENVRHNAFEIRQNGDIYCSDGTNDVKLQDTITATAANTTALGGLKLVKLTQAEYDALTTKDNSTLYVIVN